MKVQDTTKRIRVALVDDHPIVRQGIKSLLNVEDRFEVITEAANAPEALSLIEKDPPDLAIVDITLEGSDGLELIKNIRAMDFEFPILVVSMHDETLYAERVLKAGGNGYVMKAAIAEVLIEAIDRLFAGKIYVSGDVQELFLQAMTLAAKGRRGVESLSDRELEVFRHIGEGRSTREVADRLNLSIKTIETYRAHIKEKLELANASELVSTAARWVEQNP